MLAKYSYSWIVFSCHFRIQTAKRISMRKTSAICEIKLSIKIQHKQTWFFLSWCSTCSKNYFGIPHWLIYQLEYTLLKLVESSKYIYKRSISYVVALFNSDVKPDKSVRWKNLNLKSCNRQFKMLTVLLSR